MLNDLMRERVFSKINGEPGWQVICVEADLGSFPSFAYTVGLHQNFNHSEVIILGLPTNSSQILLNTVGARVKRGDRLNVDFPYTDIVQSYPVMFKSIHEKYVSQYFKMMFHLYGNSINFSGLQMCWTDESGLFPWNTDFNPELVTTQPMLF